MLHLDRTVGETIKIGEGVVIHVLHIEGGKVRLGFDADRSIPILRGEVKDDGRGRKVLNLPSATPSKAGAGR